MTKKLSILFFIILLGLLLTQGVLASEYKIKKVIASSIEKNDSNLGPKKAIDGNMSTRWASQQKDPQWIYFDFGKKVSFDFVNIIWEAAYGEVYDIQVSNDAKKWKTVAQIKDGDGNEDKIYIGKQKKRYVRIYGIKRGTNWGYSIFEFNLENLDDPATPSSPLKLSLMQGDDTIFLDWNDNIERDLKGYNIYRSTTPKGEYKKLNTESLIKSKYKDKTIIKEQTYYYHVTAIDYSGKESKPSEEVQGILEQVGDRKFFSIPDCAWKRYIGDIPDATESASPNRGVALGGFGAGSFMYNISGSFGPFQSFDNVIYKGKWLPDAAFHIYEKIGDNKPTVKCLSIDTDTKKSWDTISLGEGIYYALQPKGWVTYNSFTTDISQKFFSPIIPNNYQQTSYPVAVWQFNLHNPTNTSCELSVMLTLPDVFVGEKLKETQWANSFIKEGDIKGVVLNSKKGIGQWCIATKETSETTVSYVTSWNAKGNGEDIWNDFKEDGELKNRALDNSNKAAAIAVKVKLEPGENKIVPIVIAWDFPVMKFGSGTEWWKKYTQHFDRSGENGFAIAKEALENYDKWEQEIDKWMNPVINNNKYPDWLKQTAFNELYYSQFGGSFYEAGLKSGHEKEYMGLHEEDNKYFIMECMLYPFASTFDVRHYSSIIYTLFWPRIELETLINWADAIMYFDPINNQTPHDCGNPWGDPYFAWDDYGTNKHHWKDLHSKFIQQCWRYWYLYKDKKFLNYVWPACKATSEYMKKTDIDGDGLPDNNKSDNTYDSWGLFGTSLLCGGLWVGAMEALIEMSDVMNDPIGDEIKKILPKAKKNLDEQLWYAKKGYYQIDTKSKNPTVIMADGLNGQRYCEAYGLPGILPTEKMKSHLKQVYERCVVPLQDFNGDGIGDCGAINGIKEDGTSVGSLQQAEEIWTGSSYFLAASMYHAGLKEEALKTAYGVHYQTYINDLTAYWFNTPEAWHDKGIRPRPESDPQQYQRPRAIWELLLEIDNPYIDAQIRDYKKLIGEYNYEFKMPAKRLITATASSTEKAELSPINAVDENMQTRWASVYGDNHWLLIDLGKLKDFEGINIYWEAAYAKEYEILVSKDKNTWAEVYSTKNGAGGTENLNFGKQSARYIKINAIKRATDWGFSIFEVELNE